MVRSYPQIVDLERLERARRLLCEVFGIRNTREHQELAAKNIIQGKTTLYDVPTGGGKTLAFWYPLFYHWTRKEDILSSQEVALVVSPLNALMNSQVRALAAKGVPALAINQEGGKIEDVYQKGSGGSVRLSSRVIFVSPQIALSNEFHEKVLKNKLFTENCVELVIDEAHCASEWGDDFRPEYAELSKLRARLPSNLPVLLASATMPEDVITDVCYKTGIPTNSARVAVSNAKFNVSLAVHILQHPTGTYADLQSLFPKDEGAEFPQTIIYVNSRTEAEQIQDFLRKHRPRDLPPDSIEFYHRHITEKRKLFIQAGLQSGSLRCVIATDALGMGMDFPSIKRIVFWHEPRTFLSLIQKIGRCVRNPDDDGQVVLFLTKVAYNKHALSVESDRGDDAGGGTGDHEEEDEPEARGDRIAAIDLLEQVGPSRRKQKKDMRSEREARDRKHLSLFIATSECRRKPWDDFFNNEGKMVLFTRRNGPDARCCDADNCNATKFLTDTIKITYPFIIRAPRSSKPSEALVEEVTSSLIKWRSDTVIRYYPNQSLIVGRYLLDDEVIAKIAERPRAVKSREIFKHVIPWGFGIHGLTVGSRQVDVGTEVAEVVAGICERHPDSAAIARQEQRQQDLVREAMKEYREALTVVFNECYDAVYAPVTGEHISVGRGKNRRTEEERKCRLFLILPRSDVYPEYYEQIKEPISMSQIKKRMNEGPSKGFSSLAEFEEAWRTLFSNAREFNEDDSLIYQYANDLENVFNKQLDISSRRHNFTASDEDDTIHVD